MKNKVFIGNATVRYLFFAVMNIVGEMVFTRGPHPEEDRQDLYGVGVLLNGCGHEVDFAKQKRSYYTFLGSFVSVVLHDLSLNIKQAVRPNEGKSIFGSIVEELPFKIMSENPMREIRDSIQGNYGIERLTDKIQANRDSINVDDNINLRDRLFILYYLSIVSHVKGEGLAAGYLASQESGDLSEGESD